MHLRIYCIAALVLFAQGTSVAMPGGHGGTGHGPLVHGHRTDQHQAPPPNQLTRPVAQRRRIARPPFQPSRQTSWFRLQVTDKRRWLPPLVTFWKSWSLDHQPAGKRKTGFFHQETVRTAETFDLKRWTWLGRVTTTLPVTEPIEWTRTAEAPSLPDGEEFTTGLFWWKTQWTVWAGKPGTTERRVPEEAEPMVSRFEQLHAMTSGGRRRDSDVDKALRGWEAFLHAKQGNREWIGLLYNDGGLHGGSAWRLLTIGTDQVGDLVTAVRNLKLDGIGLDAIGSLPGARTRGLKSSVGKKQKSYQKRGIGALHFPGGTLFAQYEAHAHMQQHATTVKRLTDENQPLVFERGARRLFGLFSSWDWGKTSARVKTGPPVRRQPLRRENGGTPIPAPQSPLGLAPSGPLTQEPEPPQPRAPVGRPALIQGQPQISGGPAQGGGR
jgi:hypothetical protein